MNQTTATLTFLSSRDAKALYHAPEAGGEIRSHEGDFTLRPVPVLNARERSTAPNLQQNGFMLAQQHTATEDFYQDEQIEAVYLPEVKKLVAEATGASCVEVFDYTRRTSSEALRKQQKLRETAAIVHNDYSDKSGVRTRDNFLEDHPELSAELKDKPFAIINVWRSIKGTVFAQPLAFCDASRLERKDLLAITRQAKHQTGELQLVVWNPEQRWYYFPQMTMDEAVVFKTFDSQPEAAVRFLPHSAFDDPDTVADAPARESIEVRCLIFFEE